MRKLESIKAFVQVLHHSVESENPTDAELFFCFKSVKYVLNDFKIQLIENDEFSEILNTDEDKEYMSKFYQRLEEVDTRMEQRLNCPCSYMPRLVVVEGLDGSGKSNLVENVCTHVPGSIKKKTPSILDSNQSNGVVMGKRVRDIFDTLHLIDPALEIYTRAYYMFSNYDLVEQMIQECELSQQRIIFIIDRFYSSTFAYTLGKYIFEQHIIHNEQVCNINSTQLQQMYPQLFRWPSDLPQPNLFLILQVNETTRSLRVNHRRQIQSNHNHNHYQECERICNDE